eukprot:c41147_g1_i1 orf=19-216(+)
MNWVSEWVLAMSRKLVMYRTKYFHVIYWVASLRDKSIKLPVKELVQATVVDANSIVVYLELTEAF